MKLKILLFAIGTALATTVQAQQHGNLRSELFVIIDEYEALARQWPGGEITVERLDELQQRLMTIPDEQFLATDPLLEQQFELLQDAADLLISVQTAIPEPPLQVRSSGFPVPATVDVDWSRVTISPSEDKPTDEAESQAVNGTCDSTKPRTARQRYDLLQADLTLAAIADIASQICSQDFVVGNASLACLVTDIASLVASGINDSESLCESLIDAATLNANYQRLAHVHGNLDSVSTGLSQAIKNASTTITGSLTLSETNILGSVSSTEATLLNKIASIRDSVTSAIATTETSLLEEISAAVTNLDSAIATTEMHLKTTIATTETNLKNDIEATKGSLATLIDNRSNAIDSSLEDTAAALAAFRDENLRHLIEMNLANASKPIASFQLPGKFGGYLELVDTIVRETIDGKLDSGQSIAQAEREYQNGRNAFDLNDYKDAYAWYRSSYKSANQ
jgi:hypothetical protein